MKSSLEYEAMCIHTDMNVSKQEAFDIAKKRRERARRNLPIQESVDCD